MAKLLPDDFDDDDESLPDFVLEEILAFIIRKYTPAKNIQEATLLKTTLEILQEIRLFYPGALIGSKTFHQFFTEAGFKYDSVEDMKFVWLIKEKL